MLGDPGVDYEGTQRCEYEVSRARGEPHWDRIFGYLLQHFGHIRFFQTAFVLVDNRDLTAPVTEQDSLAHWPTVAAWWASRLSLHVDGRQKTVFTVLRGRLCLMYVMHLSTMTMLPPLAQMPNRDGGTGMKTMLWNINVIPN